MYLEIKKKRKIDRASIKKITKNEKKTRKT